MLRPRRSWTAVSAVSLLFACTSEQVSPPHAAEPIAPADVATPAVHLPTGGGPEGTPCLVDADCGLGLRCELRICLAGCIDDDDCTAAEFCDAHGRCLEEPGSLPPALAGSPFLSERRTTIPFGQASANTRLRNDGTAILHYRLAGLHSALEFDPEPASLAPGEEAELAVTVDLTALAPTDRLLPLHVITDAGPILWVLDLESVPTDSIFRGSLALELDSAAIGSTDLSLAVDFHDDGTLVARVDPTGSILFPHTITGAGTWTPIGDFELTLRETLPPAPWQASPLARGLGREFILSGTIAEGRTIEGDATETLTGLRDAPLQALGSFVLRQHASLPAPLGNADPVPAAVSPPAWVVPPGLDAHACDDLGIAYGTTSTLTGPSSACDACSDGTCSGEDMLTCGDAIWDAAHHLPEVLGALQSSGEIAPPAGEWTWLDCTTDEPTYTDQGTTCFDDQAIRCATALLREGARLIPGPWGQASARFAADHARQEAEAVALLTSERLIDAAFAYRDLLGEPASGVLGRELDILTGARERLAAALAPLLSPAYDATLKAIAEEFPDAIPAITHTLPLRLATRLSEVTALRARLALQAGEDPAAVRAEVRDTALALHALALEAHARLEDFAAADPAADLHALGPALDQLSAAFRDLSFGASAFGYPASYVPMALSPQDIELGRTNFDAVYAFAADDLTRFTDVAQAAWQAMRDYEEKTHSAQATSLQIAAEYDARLRALCGTLPGDTAPDLAHCGDHGGQIAELRAGVMAAGLRIEHAAQSLVNNQHAIAVEEERFAAEAAATAELGNIIHELNQSIFVTIQKNGETRSTLMQVEGLNECGQVQAAADAQADLIESDCKSKIQDELLSGPTILGFSTPDWRGIHLARKGCEAEQQALDAATKAQCAAILGQAGLQSDLEELARDEQVEIMAVNEQIDQAIRESQLKVSHAASIALIKNLRADALLLQIEIREAELARSTALTALWSAFGEVAALAQEKARALGILLDDNPDNALTRPHFLQARLESAARVLRARELTVRRLYLALRALEYELNQELTAPRADLARARSPEDFAAVFACLDHIAEDYRLTHGYGQPYVTEISLREDIFGITHELPDVDGTPASPAEQFQALLRDPAHHKSDGTIALPFTLSATPAQTLFSTWLCDDRIDRIEVKLIGDHLGDREAEVMLTRQGVATVRRCDAGYASYSFDRDQLVIQAGVNDWNTAGPNAGFAAWPVHGEQWTLTIPPGTESPANADFAAEDIADVVIRLHHRASTVAPTEQFGFTPTCG